jgi:RNA polymerase sigma factor for flagellar operon FliA
MSTTVLAAYQTNQNLGALDRDQLILLHMPLVRWAAARIHERLPDSILYEDLVSIGTLGLIAAIDNYDPSQSTKISTYAEYRIRGAILDSVRGADGIPAHKRRLTKQIQGAILALEQRLQRTPLEEEIASELGVPVHEYREWLSSVRAVQLGSLDASIGESGTTLGSFVMAPEDDSPARILERSELGRLLEEGIEKMPEIERLVITLYFKEELNLREIAPILNLHFTRVAQLKTQGILRLRGYMEKKWPGKRAA